MKNEFIPYDIALAMKEIGFDEPCVATFHDNSGGEIEFTFGMFHHPKKNSEANTVSGTFIGKNGCYAPLYQQAFRFFREKHGLHHQIGWFGADKYLCGITPSSYTAEFETHKEAELSCLRKLIEIVNQNKEDEK